MLKFKNQDAYEARFRALQIVDERAAVKSVNGVLPDDAGAITLAPADINAVSVEDVANIRGTFRINVTSSNGVYSADKTFDEIKTAYEAGQQPYVVYTSLTSNYIYTLADTYLPSDGAGTGFISFESYSISDAILETSRLRIFSRTLENGSNIELQVSPYNGQGVVGIQSVEQTATSTEDGGANIITVTKTDGTSSTFTVKNGSKGSTGATGADGKSAYQYAQESGYTGTETEFAEKLASGETIPEYVRSEAETVARIVNQHQSNDSIVFPFLSDAHCGYYTDTGNAATTLAGQLLNQIGKRVPYDFIVHGGDYSTGAWNTTKLNSFEQIEDYTELTSEADKGVLSLWCAGNHDDAPCMATEGRVSQQETFALIGRKNRISGASCPNGCNYGYLDLENRKLRVIYLDTDDKRNWGTVLVSSSADVPEYLNAQNVGGDQLRWLANTGLDFTDKANPAEWKIVVVSHAALNISGTNTDAVSGTVHAHNTENAAKIINAYRTGKSGSITHNGVTVNYDFSAVGSKATVICAVHGHNHKFCTETLTGGILSIGCPNVMNGRERASDDGNTYAKTAGTANGTSFCILTVDMENHKIYADCVGVGYDREFTYTTEVAAYTNQIPISTDTDGSVYGYKAGYRLNSGGAAEVMSGSYLTGFIPVSVGDTVYMKNVEFKYGVSSGLTSDNQRLSFYNASKTHVYQASAVSLAGNVNGIKGDDNIWTQFTPKSTMGGVDCSGVAYFRINAAYIGDDSIITVNEPIG